MSLKWSKVVGYVLRIHPVLKPTISIAYPLQMTSLYTAMLFPKSIVDRSLWSYPKFVNHLKSYKQSMSLRRSHRSREAVFSRYLREAVIIRARGR